MKKLLAALLLLSVCMTAGSQAYRNEWIDYSKTYYKFTLAKNGLCRISQSQLVSLGIAGNNANHFKLWRNGVEVPLYTSIPGGVLGAADYIEFWGTKNDGKPDTDLYLSPSFQCVTDVSIFTDTAAYFLTVVPGSNSRVVAAINDTVGHGTAEPYCMYDLNYAWDPSGGAVIWGGYASFIQNEYVRSAAFDKGEGFQSGRFSNFPFTLSSLKAYMAGPPMTYTTVGTGRFIGNRNVSVYMNDSLLDQKFNFDFSNFSVSVSNIPLSRISGDATTIKNITSDPSEYGRVSLAKYSLLYPRVYDFGSSSNFPFKVPANPSGAYLVISNFNAGGVNPILYDITNNKRYTCFQDGALIKVKMDPSAATVNCILISDAPANVTAINNFTTRNFVDFALPANHANFVIIANKILNSGGNNQVEAYRAYRASAPGGAYSAKIFDIDEIADQFAFGIRKHSISIFNFLRYSRDHFTTPPKFALLVGRGVNYLDFYSKQSQPNAERLNQVPSWGNPGSDNMLGAINVNSPIPVTPIGRISVINNDELKIYLDKVKEFEQLQANNIQTQASKDYTKHVLHLIGASDATTGSLISPLMESYRTIIRDTLMGADVHSYIKANNPNIAQSTAEVAGYFNSGVSLLTYFGHSSATSLDFNLNNPSDYTNTNGKYPVFLVNGCNAGNFFSYDENRISNNTLTISEKFVLAPARGSIAFIASTHFGVLNTLDYITKEWYNAACKTSFGKSLGEIQQKAIEQTWALYNGDFHTRLTLEETTIHGDPSLKLFPYIKPDYSVELQNISFSPSFISSANDSFLLKVIPHNLGRASNDSVWLRVQRQFPNGTIKLIKLVKLPRILHNDTVTISIPVVGNKEKGTNYIIATIDPENTRDEISEANNTATRPFEVSDDEIRPIYPYNYSIVAKNSFKLYGSTADPLEPSRTYRMQTDTTELFNSPLLATQDVVSTGGVVEFDPAIAVTDGKVYYWRLAVLVAGTPVNWRTASYLYNPSGTTGFNQSHVYQHLKSGYQRMTLDSTGEFNYGKRVNNLFITHSKYPESGVEDNHFSISVNGASIIASACLGSSIIFNVFDSTTFKPWLNTGNLYGGGPACAISRQYNFEYPYTSAADRKKAMDFMNLVPNGAYVAARLVVDNVALSFSSVWKADTALYGSGQSLYHYLYNQGAKQIDSVNASRNGGGAIWTLVYRKNDSLGFVPHFKYSQGFFDRVIESVDCPTIDTAGYISSPVFGPAKAWQQVHWRGHSTEPVNSPDSIRLSVIGVKKDGSETMLYQLNKTQLDFDISGINAITYPFIKLKLYIQDSLNATPWQLDYWRLNYLPVPEGALAPNLYYAGADSTVYDTVTQSSKYNFGVAFKNVSDAGFDSVRLKLKLIDNNGVEKLVSLPKIKPIIMGDTARIYFELNADTLSGSYNLYLDVNPDGDQAEQFHFNNYLYKSVTVYRPDSSGICPGLSKSFSSGSQAIGNTYQWQVDNGTGFVNITNGAVYSGTTADSLKLNAPPTSWYGYKYRCAITNNLVTTYSVEYKLKFAVTWTGAQNTAWENTANWGCGKLPDQYTDVYIKSTTPNDPFVNSNASCRSVRLMPNTTVNVKAGFILDIKGPSGN
ncbi:MAG: C25 family cysteine peptidase [Bacteroidota bacterium]